MHRIVGLDVSATGVRFVALESGFRGFELQDARRVELATDGAPADVLRAALAALGVLPDDAVAIALPASMVTSHVFSLPFTDPKRIEAVLPAEVEGVIPFDLGDVIWDHALLSSDNGKSEVLVGVVRRDALRDQLAVWHAAGVEPRTVTFGPLAFGALAERRLIDTALGQEDVVVTPEGTDAPVPQPEPAAQQARPALILEAGPDRVQLVVLREERVELVRSLVSSGTQAWEAARTDPAALDRLLGPLLRDVKISLRSRGAAGAPKRVLLAGDLASLPLAAERVAQELRLPCRALVLDAETKLPPGTLSDAEAAFPLALAVRAQQPRGHINFRKGEFAFTKDRSKARGQVMRLGVAAGVLFALALGLGIARLSALSSEAQAYDEALCTATKKILGECVQDYRMALSRMSGGGSKAAGIPRVSGAEVLAEVLSHLPEGAMPLLDDLEVTTTSVRLKGVAESFGQVDQIIASLRGDKCFGEIKQPRVEKQRDSSKVQFSLDFPYTCAAEGGGA